ncbi:MAG: HD domain-containing protein [Lachnospiraceae bacterium]|jgi:HD-GYP domain-containing protein (c-di-GMP phosphodiesterase class II)|nr:HD domain-containing protein [Lachnospiraceae bacterium]
MAVEYITSRNMADLIYETVRLMNKTMAHHGMRVSYIMAKMLETQGTYEKYEIADFMVLALLHDIGAYKTDDVRKTLTFESKSPTPHSVYGYLFLRYLSPLEEQSKMILYHHMDYSKTQDMDYKYRFELEVLKVAEIMDIWQRSFGAKFDYRLIDKYAGTKYDPEVCRLLARTVEEHDIFTKIRDNSYKAEYSECLEYILLSDIEKEKYLKMLMYCTGLKDEQMVSETVATIYVCRELGRKLKLSELDKNEVYYAALLHDIGMLAIPSELLDAPRTLSEEEKNLVKTHVDIMEKTLDRKLSKEIIRIAAGHHERFDGSGYPRGLKASVMGEKEAILQISEQVINAMEPKPYREAYTKEEIVDELNNGIISGKYEGIVADTFLKHYDEIMEKAKQKADMALITHQKLQRNYNQVYTSLS